MLGVPPVVSTALLQWDDGLHLDGEVNHSRRASRVWRATSADGQPMIVKLTFDVPDFVEPGFRVAAFVQDATGIHTGYPRACRDGSLTVPILIDGQACTLAVMEHVAGTPVTRFDQNTAAEAGRLLAAIHRATIKSDAPPVPARVLDWFAHWLPPSAAGARKALDRLERLTAQIPLSQGVIYGDPSPELLVQSDGMLALIDWGTPSYGPLLIDAATWKQHVSRHSAEVGAAERFLDAYRLDAPLAAAEYGAIDEYTVLWRALNSGPIT